MQTFECTGARPEVGTELYSRMLDVGLEPDPKPIAEIAIHMANGEIAYRRWAQFARSFLPKIIEYRIATEKDVLNILDQLRVAPAFRAAHQFTSLAEIRISLITPLRSQPLALRAL